MILSAGDIALPAGIEMPWHMAGGIFLINYEEELKKFKPSLDVDEAEGAIYSRDLTDVIDILKEMMKETSENEKDSKR